MVAETLIYDAVHALRAPPELEATVDGLLDLNRKARAGRASRSFIGSKGGRQEVPLRRPRPRIEAHICRSLHTSLGRKRTGSMES
jgi:hypothetical protein